MLIFPTPKLSPLTGSVGYGGGATGLSTHSGTPKYSLFFNDEDDYIKTGDFETDPSISAFVFAGWVKFVNGPNQCAIIAPSNATGIQLRWTSDTVNRIENTNSAFLCTSDATTWSNDTWYHYAASYDGTNKRLYQNGTMIGKNGNQTPLGQNTGDWKMGQNYNGSSHNGYYVHSMLYLKNTVGGMASDSGFTVPTDSYDPDNTWSNDRRFLVGMGPTTTTDYGGSSNWTAVGDVTVVNDHPWA